MMTVWKILTRTFFLVILASTAVPAQDFDFDKLTTIAQDYTVIIEMEIEISLGTQSNQQEQRMIGTVVSEDGLIIFDGSSLDFEHPYSVVSGSMFKATPGKIVIKTLDDLEFSAEYIGVDRYTKIGFVKFNDMSETKLKPVKFNDGLEFKTGMWVGILSPLPKHVKPRLGAGIGMLAAVLTSPEFFPVTTGFRQIQATSVLYNQALQPLGVLGLLNNFSDAANEQIASFDPFGDQAPPIVGIITAGTLNKLIAEPPTKGNSTRAWLGITLQAMTPDIADLLKIEAPGGIIVNNVVNGSPASEAGLTIGDVIYRVNGQPVEVDSEEKVPIFQRVISEMEPGSAVEFTVYRSIDNSPQSIGLTATLEAAPMPARDAPEYENKQLDIKFRDLVFSDYLYYNLDEETLFGTVITKLESGGLGMMGGLEIGDIVQQIDGQPVNSVEDIQSLLEKIEEKRPEDVIFFVFRNSKTLFVNLKTGF